MTWSEFWGFISIATMVLIALVGAIAQRHREDVRDLKTRLDRLEAKLFEIDGHLRSHQHPREVEEC